MTMHLSDLASLRAPIPVLQVIDSLVIGGGERVAVNVANLLPHERFEAHLCVTRYTGPLEADIAPHVHWLVLNRQSRLSDLQAIYRLVRYIREHNIKLLHAHKDSLFIATAATLFPPRPALIWHDHYGRYAIKERPAWLYGLGARRAKGVISVNHPLVDWTRDKLRVPAERVWYVPNFVHVPEITGIPSDLPGSPGNRIVCVANVRPQKDILTLIRGMALVVSQAPDAHLLIVGAASDRNYMARVQDEITQHGLEQHVSLLGSRQDVPAILRACDIGVLSSTSEGLPLTLLEYGMAELPVVVTDIGQCAEVLNSGDAGILVPPGAPEQLATGVLSLLRSTERRTMFGERLHRRVQEQYSADSAVNQICQIYDRVLGLR